MSTTGDYSGVILDQNVLSTNANDHYTPPPGALVYQQFFLPLGYARGTTPEEVVYPDLSGFQLLVGIPSGGAPLASITYTIDQYTYGVGWGNLARGQVVGCHADGSRVWFDVVFPSSISITPNMAPTIGSSTQTSDLLRFGISTSGIDYVWIGQPNPLSGTPNAKAMSSDQTTPLVSILGNQFSFGFRLLALVADSGTDQYGNPYRSALAVKSAADTSTTSGQNSGFYLSPPQPSQFAVVSNYFDVRSDDDAVVIDSVLIDPITPNPTVNVYSSNDPQGPGVDDPSWENLLWTYVTTLQVGHRTTFALPTPVTAQFMKLEYTGLQAQPYDPGQRQAPTRYRKFPKWVADFFILQLEQPGFVANRINVVYDALTFAYAYLLDDLRQSPDAPAVAPTTTVQQVASFFNTHDDVSDQVDPLTLSKINLVLNTYQNPPGALGDRTTALGASSRAVALAAYNYPVEGGPLPASIDYSDVSSLNRDPLVFEQGLPAMYFYLTCRHAYRQLTASFEHNRAYFVGINEVAFIRNDYTTSIDTPLYIESGGDLLNVDQNDFVVDANGVWTVPTYSGPYSVSSLGSPASPILGDETEVLL